MNTYRPDIDGLRAFSVAAVIAYHAQFLGFGGGFVGVDIFFVISGFLITGQLTQEVQRTGTISLNQFYSKRIRRLFPSLFFLIFSTTLIWYFNFSEFPDSTRSFVKSIKYSVFGFANIFFARQTGGYFDSSSEEMPLLHFWSLGVEEQFYLIWPILVLLCQRYSKRTGLVWLLTLGGLCSLFFSLFFIAKGSTNAVFYWMPFRVWELSLGSLLVIYFGPLSEKLSASRKNVFWTEILSIFGMGFIIFSIFIYSANHPFGLGLLLPCIGTTLVILSGGQSHKSLVRCVLSSKGFVFVGILSYGLYLWHWPLLAFARIWSDGELPALSWRILAILLSFFMSIINLRLVENPVRHKIFFKSIKPRWVFLSMILLSFSLIWFSTWVEYHGKLSISNDQKLFNHHISERSILSKRCEDQIEKVGTKDCSLGTDSPETEIILWGDSHSTSHVPMIEDFIKKHPVRLTLYSHSSLAPFYPEMNFYHGSRASILGKRKFNELVVRNIENKFKTSIVPVSVVLAARWMGYSHKYGLCEEELNENARVKLRFKKRILKIKSSFEHVISKLNQMGVHKILIVQPGLEFRNNVNYCFEDRKQCELNKEKFEKFRLEVNDMLHNLKANHQNIRLLDPATIFCNDFVCKQVVGRRGQRVPVVLDRHHLSVAGSRLLGEKYKEDLEWLISP